MRSATNGGAVLRVHHRSPRPPDRDPLRPQRASAPDRPGPASPPTWSTVVTGVITGLAVAAVSGHWYFAMFSVVTGVVSGSSWIMRVILHRRRSKKWRAATDVIEAGFAEDCERCARELAHHRRQQHPSMADIELEIRMGGTWFWHKRRLDHVSVGHGIREISVVEGAPVVVLDHIPVLVDVSPGQMIGLHGRRATAALRALLVRMASYVGPSDWQLFVLGDIEETWQELRRLPHFASSTLSDSTNDRIENGRRHLVVLTFDTSILMRHAPVMRVFERGSTTVIVVAGELHELPAECGSIIDSDSSEVDGLGTKAFEGMCRSIASWIDPDVEASALPEQVSFAELVTNGNVSVDGVIETWTRRRGRGPCIDLGMDAMGVVHLELDRDGPHGVIVGTTGSGKSEVLRQIVLSIAWNSSPSDVSFVLVDYKGGSAFDACAELPHVVGVITDLDQGMANRVLFGLETELKRREEVLRTARVGNVWELRRVQDEMSIDPSLARLVVVIDELAALREDTPEFVSALAAIAQRGRSLGLHLIVASQRSAALTADVVANASLRIALRVQTVGDSSDVIGSDAATHIERNRPGRLIAKVGGDAARLVQAAHVSDSVGRLVDVISRACELEGTARPGRPWSDPLPSKVRRPDGDSSGSLGIIDDPRLQRHELWSFSWDQHVLVVGGVGRTNAIRAFAHALGDRRSDIDMIIVSCRPSRADGFSRLGVEVGISDRERLMRALQLCEARIQAEKICRDVHRRLVVFIDDIDVWYEQTTTDRVGAHLWDSFEQILAANSAGAVVCIATSSRERGLPNTLVARMGSIWTGTGAAGSFHVRTRTAREAIEVRMFWEDPDPDAAESCRSDSNSAALENELSYLPEWVRTNEGSFAVHADSRKPIAVRSHEQFRFLVIGPHDSGVTTALRSLTRSWAASHPNGRILDVTARSDVSASTRTNSCWLDSLSADEPHLLVIDDVHRQSIHALDLSRLLDDPNRWGLMSIIVGATPTFVRARPEHWIQQVRRARTGVLLGRSVDEDCDLLGLHVPPIHVYARSAGRGLWVDGGAAMGIVQFVAEHTP